MGQYSVEQITGILKHGRIGRGDREFILLLLNVRTTAVTLTALPHSLAAALLVMVNLPLALIGNVAAIAVGDFMSGAKVPIVSIASLVGFITLFGIALRNGLLLVNHYRHLLDVEGASLPDAIVRDSLERLSPILMTALCAALGLLPLAYTAGRPGSELLAPMAFVVLGGLLSSTVLNLVVVPVGYALVRRVPRGDFIRSPSARGVRAA